MNGLSVSEQMAAMLGKVLGKTAWDTYKDTVGGKAFNGDPLPTWEEMEKDPAKTQIVCAWQASALAVAVAFSELQK